jgi:hypothetical protein
MYIPYVWIVLALTIWLIDIVLPCVSKHGKCCSLQCFYCYAASSYHAVHATYFGYTSLAGCC